MSVLGTNINNNNNEEWWVVPPPHAVNSDKSNRQKDPTDVKKTVSVVSEELKKT